MFLDEESSSDQEEMTERYYDASSPEEINKLTESNIRHESDDAERQVQEEEEEEEETEEQYFDACSHDELFRRKRLLSNMFLVEESSSDKEEMTGRYYDASSPEEMNKLTESYIRHESNDAERQVQVDEEEEEEFEEQYFDAYSHEDLFRQKKTNNSLLPIRNVGQKLKNGDCEESSGDIWIPPNERIGSYFNLRISNSHEDSHISKVSVNVDQYINDFDTFLAEETNSEKGTEASVEQQSENSENSSVAVGFFSDQRMEESIDTQMSESQSKMRNPKCSSYEDQETFLGNRTPFYNNLTESQDDTDNSENSSSVEEEEEKYSDSNLPKEYEKLPICKQVSTQPAEVEPMIGGREQTGNELDNCGRDLGLVPTKVDARYRSNAANCRVFVNIIEYISPISESKQLLSTIAIQVAGHDNSLDLVNNFGKTFHMYGWYLGLIRTKVDAKYLRNVANCRVFISIEEYITPISESEQILQTAMVFEAACTISFCLTKSGKSTKSLHDLKKSIYQKEKHVMFLYYFAKFEVIFPGKRMTVSAIFPAIISEYEQKWLTVFGGLHAELMKRADKSDYGSEAFAVVKTRRMIYQAQYFLKNMTQIVGKYSTNYPECNIQPLHLIFQQLDNKCSTGGEKNAMTERVYRVETFKEGVIKNKTYTTKTSILMERNARKTENDISVDNRFMGTNSGTTPNYPDDSNYARKCLANKEEKHKSKQVQPFETTHFLFMTSNQETLDGNKQGDINETPDEKYRFAPSKDLSQNTFDKEKQNSTHTKLDKVHNALGQRKIKTPIDEQIEKTQKERLKEIYNKSREHDKKNPDVFQKKQSLDDDKEQLEYDVMQRNLDKVHNALEQGKIEKPIYEQIEKTQKERLKEINNKSKEHDKKDPDVCQKKQSLDDDKEQLKSDAMQRNLDKVQNVLEHGKMETPIDEQTEKTQKDRLKKKYNKSKEHDQKDPDVCQKKQSLDDDKEQLKSDAMQRNLDKVQNVLEHGKMETPIDEQIEKTEKDRLKKKYNKSKEHDQKDPDVCQQKQSLDDDKEQLKSDAMQRNLDKVQNVLEHGKMETPIDEQIEKTEKERLKKKYNKSKEHDQKDLDVCQKKQSLDDDKEQLESDAMQRNGKKTFGVKVNFSFAFLLRLMMLLSLSMGVASTNNVCKETVSIVLHCPTTSEYQQRALEKCSGLCGDPGINYEYHCVRDSTKTFLVELCAISFYLFDYCVEYDAVGNLIQMDTSTRCNSYSKKPIYKSSEAFFCNPDSCLHLPIQATDANQSTSTTESTSENTLTTPLINSANTDKGDIKPSHSWLYVLVGVTVLSLFVIVVIITATMHYIFKRSQINGTPTNQSNGEINPLVTI